MTPADYRYLQDLLRQRSGLSLSDDKHYLIESRLRPLVRRNGHDSVGDFVATLRQPGAEAFVTAVVEAMMTHESFFFRDRTPFEQIRDFVVPSLLAARSRQKHIRIWSAGCSHGQEPYSLAMTLLEMERQLAGYRIEILATDLSSDAIDRASSGAYSQFEVQRGLPIHLLVKYFVRADETWQIAPRVRAMIDFRRLNLLHEFPRHGVFDLVLCRNVLIYFDHSTKVSVLNRLAAATAPNGYLVLGAAETVIGLTHALVPVRDRRGFYAPRQEAGPGPAARFQPRLVAEAPG